MEQAKLSSRIKARARVIFPWLATSKSGIAIQRTAKSPFAYTLSSARSSTRSLSLDQPVVEQPAVLQRRSEELHQREQAAVHSKPRLPIIPVLDRIDCDEILKNHSGSYNAEQNSVASLRQDISLALLRTASECVFATVELLDSNLLLLPAKNLFILQRVSRTWKQIVAQSMAIQRKMFLRLNKTSPVSGSFWILWTYISIISMSRFGKETLSNFDASFKQETQTTLKIV